MAMDPDVYSGTISRPAGAAIGAHLAAIISNGTIIVAPAGGPIDGITEHAITALSGFFLDGEVPGGTLNVSLGDCTIWTPAYGAVKCVVGAAGATADHDAMVGANGTFVDASGDGVVVGRFQSTGASGSEVLIKMNERPQQVYAGAGSGSLKVGTLALSGAAIHAAVGGVVAWQNPEGVAIIIQRAVLNVTTPATDAGGVTFDVGVTATSATTSSDTLLDGVDVHTSAAVFDSMDPALDSGANAHAQSLAAGKWITVDEKTGDATGLVGTLYVYYTIA